VADTAITAQAQERLLADLKQLAAWRATEEAAVAQRDAVRLTEARREHQQLHARATAAFEQQHAQLIAEYQQASEAVYLRYESEGCSLAVEEQRLARVHENRLAESLEAAKTLRQHRVAEIQKAFREQKLVPKTELTKFQQQCEESAQEVATVTARAQTVVRRRAPWPDEQPAVAPLPTGLSRQQYVDHYTAAMSAAYAKLQELVSLRSARFAEEGWPVLIFIALLAALGYPAYRLVGTYGWGWVMAASVGVALLITVVIYAVVRPLARAATLRRVPELQQAIGQARAALAAALRAAGLDAERQRKAIVRRASADLAAAKGEYKTSRREQKALHDTRLKQWAAEFATRRKIVEDTHERELDQTEEKHPRRIESLEHEFAREIAKIDESLRTRLAAFRDETSRERSAATSRWSEGLDRFHSATGAMAEYCERIAPPWEAIAQQLQSPDAAKQIDEAAALRIGRLEVDVPDVKAQLPAVLSYPECPSLLLEAADDGRDAATQAMQSVMLRLLTTFPPGKVRFTIIDPVGLGENFSAFMHLADYDERLVTNRIWTEATHIQQRLTDLTEHMENVIQKYLRNEFGSIQEYNRHAGEVAEPFQILVVANFPANFSDEAARRLVSIATSGARCGVYTLISTDTRLATPRNFDLADLEAQAATLVWNAADKQFRFQSGELATLPLALDEPPADEQFTEIIRQVGVLAKDAARVEVPFDYVVPPVHVWWTADSRGGIETPLGRAGAKALQYLRLGKGTSQHVLVAGKTGSGKSTLLNSLITNLSLHYSPQELEFYLIDFKKGVEFKAYATHKLPHARVIAIESEREFGLSVLQRLDDELKRRGDLFRQHGVQDVKGFRSAAPDAIMPRVLLVIDEFQEFFTSDDRISHDASLLLDRLVRQGRAFGIHVLLGSQTLAGAYSLARSTIGQMAVRIALQCSESDAHLILSEDNTAARLLGRPGEAIYNDANGLFEGNHPFQVVWLSDEQRESYLARVSALAAERGVVGAPVVFEGSAAADPRDNRQLAALFNAPRPQQAPSAPQAWLGAAVAVKEPTAIPFRRQSGSNLLIVGQQEELALGMLATAAIALAGQLPAVGLPRESDDVSDARLVILDGTRPDAPEAGLWARFASQLPLGARVVPPRDAAAAITSVAQEVERRLAAGEQTAEPIFVVIYNLARFRDLKKGDDYSFDDDASAGVGKQLTTILREGPALGVHALVWCDSYNNANRWLDRQTLRDFELRVLFQMSATDSSNLMDSAAASKLGPHMTLLYSEELGQAEKLRPYGLPPAEWLAWVAERLTARGTADDAAAAAAVSTSSEATQP
jgi:energy-coupling factor transporter ATP-binding protein EcfA2